jgi:hypothetical protein
VKATIGIYTLVDYSVAKKRQHSSKLVDEKSGENTLKITKKKIDPYNLEMIFIHKD